MKVTTKVAGMQDLSATLLGLEPKVYRKAARESMDDVSKLVLGAVRGKVATRTKSLRKALGRKVKALKSGTGYYGVVGPRKDSKKRIAQSELDFAAGKRKRAMTFRFKKTVKHQGREFVVDPAKYAHLVEFGHAAVRPKSKKALSDGATIFGKRTKAVSPQPFMRPGWDESEAAAKGIVKAKLTAATKEASRTRKGKR